MSTVKMGKERKFKNIWKCFLLKLKRRETNSGTMYVAHPPSVLVLADLQNFVNAKCFLFDQLQNLTLTKLKTTTYFCLWNCKHFLPQTFHYANFKIIAT